MQAAYSLRLLQYLLFRVVLILQHLKFHFNIPHMIYFNKEGLTNSSANRLG